MGFQPTKQTENEEISQERQLSMTEKIVLVELLTSVVVKIGYDEVVSATILLSMRSNTSELVKQVALSTTLGSIMELENSKKRSNMVKEKITSKIKNMVFFHSCAHYTSFYSHYVIMQIIKLQFSMHFTTFTVMYILINAKASFFCIFN